jgi:hypothetical protein
LAALTVEAAAKELRRSTVTIRRWLAEGAPCVRPGRSGRNGSALVDVAALRAWRARNEAGTSHEVLEQIAERFREFHRASGHRAIGLSDNEARLYLAALFEHVAIRSDEERWADEHPLFPNCSAK